MFQEVQRGGASARHPWRIGESTCRVYLAQACPRIARWLTSAEGPIAMMETSEQNATVSLWSSKGLSRRTVNFIQNEGLFHLFHKIRWQIVLPNACLRSSGTSAGILFTSRKPAGQWRKRVG